MKLPLNIGLYMGFVAVAAACSGGDRALGDDLDDGAGTGSDALQSLAVKEDILVRKNRVREYFRNRLGQLPIVATTKTDSGQIVDWVPRPKDLALPPPLPETRVSALALKHLELTKGQIDKAPIDKAPGVDQAIFTEIQLQKHAQGPADTIPVVRFDVEKYLELVREPPENPYDVLNKVPPPAPASNDRYYGVWQRTSGGPYYGSAGRVNIWNTTGPVAGETSIGQVAVIRGTPMQAIEAGKLEFGNPGTGIPYFFVFYRTNGSATGDWVGGYDTAVDGWQQYSSRVSPGMSLAAWNSTLNGTQYSLDVEVRIHQGNWWVWAAGEWAGYYPRCKQNDSSSTCANKGYLFSNAGIRNQADRLDWYGGIFDSTAPSPTSTDMGSGRFASEGWSRAAYFRNLTYFWAPATYWWWDSSTTPRATDSNCYTVSAPFFSNDAAWHNWFYFGGPGNESSTCK